MQSEAVEAALTSAIPELEDLIEICAKRVAPDRAASTVARARSLIMTISAKIGEAEAALT